MASYSPVFSSQFIVYTDETPNTLFQVPAGFTAVVRDFTLANNVALPVVALWIANSEVADECRIAFLKLTTPISSDQWTGRVVVPENGYIGVDGVVVGDSYYVYVGGYLLRNNLT